MRKSVSRSFAIVVAAGLISSFALPAAADRYDPKASGHPLRILAYVVHPVGVILDLLIFRPAHWIGSQGPLAEFFGHDQYDD